VTVETRPLDNVQSLAYFSPEVVIIAAILLVIVALTACAAVAAQTHTTVRHYRERIDDTPPEIAQAEDAIQKNDFTGAETLLRKAIDKDPNNHQAWSYQAWFDLGFVLNRLARTDPLKVQLLEMRYFGGMTAEESAALLSLSVHVVRRELRLGQAWLHKELAG